MDPLSQREILRMKWDNAKRKLVKQTKKNADPETLDRSKKEMREKWELLMECQSSYLAQLADVGEKRKERDEYTELDDEQEEIIEAADEIIKAAEKAKKEAKMNPEAELAKRNKSEIVAKQEDFETKLSNIVVSKSFKQAYLDKLKETEIEKWTEKSQCKIVYGIDPDFYEKKFIGEGGLFQRASGVDEETLASLEMVTGSGGMQDQMKTFSAKPHKSGNKIGGKFGMYAATRRSDGSNNIDVVYTVYDFEADLMGDGDKRMQWMKAEVNSINDKDDLITRLKGGDIAALTENFIVSKALEAFAQSNVIKKVNWVEDQELV